MRVNFAKAEYPAKTGNIVVFASMLFHETGINEKEEPRISISGDVLLTMRKGLNQSITCHLQRLGRSFNMV